MYKLLTLSCLLAFVSCDTQVGNTSLPQEELSFSIQELTDQEYPDNPDIGFRSKNYSSDFFREGQLIPKPNGEYDILIHTMDKYQDTIIFKSIDLDEFIPTVPGYIKDYQYLSYITLINQEWNRNQVRFNTEEFYATDQSITRVDVARNCLNSFLWEVIVFVNEEGKDVPIHHGWFHFPEALYKSIFKKKNKVDFSVYQEPLEHWINPKNEEVDLSLLREEIRQQTIAYQDLSAEPYPIAGARKKKFKEIIFPKQHTSMKDFQTDKTTFATFTPPGFYNKKDPRKTELGRFYTLEDMIVSEIKSKANDNKGLYEIKLHFTDKDSKRKTKLVIGGLDFNAFPVLDPDYANSAWKSSMGIGNHPFYETYEEHEQLKCNNNPYYALLLDEENKFLDSHTVGIDGPIFHFEKGNENILHLWLLSFERHALVGHYTISLPSHQLGKTL